jgi:hypothetical protein
MESEKYPIIQLEIDEYDEISGVDAISFVDRAATKYKWNLFEEFSEESYNDYPRSVSANACRALKWVEKNGWGSCGTNVGKIRANQLCKREKISVDTISRMSAFKRHQQNKDVPYDKGCGGLIWDAWGGTEGIEWAQRKLNQLKLKTTKKFQEINEEKRIITAPVFIADTPIRQYDEVLGTYYVKVTPETILKMMKKYFKQNKIHRVNEQHNGRKMVDNVYMIESYIVGDNVKSELYPDLPKGSWVASFYVDDEEYWNELKNGEFTGISLEGMFAEVYTGEMIDKMFSSVENILNSNLPDNDKEEQIKLILRIK